MYVYEYELYYLRFC